VIWISVEYIGNTYTDLHIDIIVYYRYVWKNNLPLILPLIIIILILILVTILIILIYTIYNISTKQNKTTKNVWYQQCLLMFVEQS
jgi:ABC-type polysaccharide transport system permease subunit